MKTFDIEVTISVEAEDYDAAEEIITDALSTDLGIKDFKFGVFRLGTD